jgi:hypothetical protein
MPPDQLKVELKLMSDNLKEMGKLECTLGELLKFYGIIILISRLRPHDRHELWGGKQFTKFVTPVDLDSTLLGSFLKLQRKSLMK